MASRFAANHAVQGVDLTISHLAIRQHPLAQPEHLVHGTIRSPTGVDARVEGLAVIVDEGHLGHVKTTPQS